MATSYPCTTCNAKPGDPCVSIGGIAKSDIHVARTRLASEGGWEFPEEE